jgi:hypothetical protein
MLKHNNYLKAMEDRSLILVRIEYPDSGSKWHKKPALNRGLRDDGWVRDAPVQGFFRREAEAERGRTEEMVRGFSRWEWVKRIGETGSFVVDFDVRERLLFVYGKETSKGCPFKLAFNESETTAVIDLLVEARSLFHVY